MQFAAARFWVVRPVGQEVVRDVVKVAAAMYVKVGSENHGSDKGEDSGQAIENPQDDGDSKRLDKDSGEAIEHDNPAEGSDKHRVVDGGRVAGIGAGDDIADQCGDDEDPEELESPDDGQTERHIRLFMRRLTVRRWLV